MPNEPCPNPSGVCHMQGCNRDSSQKRMGFNKGERGPEALKICKNCYVKRETAEKKALKAAMAKRAAQASGKMGGCLNADLHVLEIDTPSQHKCSVR